MNNAEFSPDFFSSSLFLMCLDIYVLCVGLSKFCKAPKLQLCLRWRYETTAVVCDRILLIAVDDVISQ